MLHSERSFGERFADEDNGAAPLHFDDVLAASSRDRSLPKKQRTRFLLLSVAARQVRAGAARRPTIESLLDEAGLARGTFYTHFKDMDECRSVLIGLFLQHVTEPRPRPKKKRTSYDAILHTNLAYCRAYEANAGLFALFSQLASENTALLRLRERLNSEWVSRIVSVVAHRRGQPFEPAASIEFEGMLRILVAMTTETLRERFVDQDPLLCRSFPTAEALARALSVIWHRTMREYEKVRASCRGASKLDSKRVDRNHRISSR